MALTLKELLESPNDIGKKFINDMSGLLAATQKDTRIGGFLWICSNKCKGPGFYFVLDPDNPPVKSKMREDDDYPMMELKPTEIIVKPPTGNESTWKCPLTTKKDVSACYDAIIKVSKITPQSNLNKRLIVKGNIGVWNSDEYTRGAIEVTINQILKSAPMGGKAGGDPARTAPSTKAQERVTLEIFHILVNGAGKNYDAWGKKGYQKMFDKLCTGFNDKGQPANINYGDGKPLGSIWAGLAHTSNPGEDYEKGIPSAKWDNDYFVKSKFDNKLMREWYYHFLLQFRHSEQFLFNMRQTPYTVYSYTQFMNFITGIITSGPLPDAQKYGVDTTYNLTQQSQRTKVWPVMGRVSQKDSWNPADVWLVNSNKIDQKMPKVAGKVDGRISYLKALKRASTITEVNMILNIAYHKKVIMGISLKKSAGSLGSGGKRYTMTDFESKRLHIEKVNLTTSIHSGDFEPKIYPVRFNGWDLNLAWDSNVKQFRFIGSSNIMHIKEFGGENIEATMRIGSGGQSGPHNINLEYAQKTPSAAAQLGKIPKNLLRSMMAKIPNVKVPSVAEALESIPLNEDTITKLKSTVTADRRIRTRKKDPVLNRSDKYASLEDYQLNLLKELDVRRIDAYFGDDDKTKPKYYGNKNTLYVPQADIKKAQSLITSLITTQPSKMKNAPEVQEMLSNRQKYLNMEKKVKAIKAFSVGDAHFKIIPDDLEKFTVRVMEARNNAKWKNSKYRMNISMNIQIMEWASDICKIRGTGPTGARALNKFLKETYLIAQKKGKVPGKNVRFGPFVKLS